MYMKNWNVVVIALIAFVCGLAFAKAVLPGLSDRSRIGDPDQPFVVQSIEQVDSVLSVYKPVKGTPMVMPSGMWSPGDTVQFYNQFATGRIIGMMQSRNYSSIVLNPPMQLVLKDTVIPIDTLSFRQGLGYVLTKGKMTADLDFKTIFGEKKK